MDSPIQDVAALVEQLGLAVDAVVEMCARRGVDVAALRDASGFEFVSLLNDAVDELLVDEATKTEFLAEARKARKLFKALLPDPAAAAHQATIAAIRSVADRITELTRPPSADLGEVADAVDQLLDRSVGAEEYVIRAAVEGSEPDPLIDLSQIDFDSLAASFAGRKRAETERLAALLKDRATAAAARNPTRQELVERIEELIARYNAGSFNNDEMLRRLVSLSQSLSKEEQRAFEETLDEESLAIFDLLTQPEPVLTDDERATVKESAKALLAKLHDQLVIDWRRRAETMAGVRTTIKDVLDTGLPEDPYPPGLFDSKVDAVFNHIVASYGDDGASVYHDGAGAPSAGGTTTLDRSVVSADTETATQVEPPTTTSGRTDQLPDIAEITEDVVERLRHDEQFVSEMAARIGQAATAQLRTVDELIE
ncbi:MAG: DUF3387 domain-containing protein, partial [Microthrixaceae bacterium]|nr:DUF3387 domain-containing protein [Microthrixaceae bacterium]